MGQMFYSCDLGGVSGFEGVSLSLLSFIASGFFGAEAPLPSAFLASGLEVVGLLDDVPSVAETGFTGGCFGFSAARPGACSIPRAMAVSERSPPSLPSAFRTCSNDLRLWRGQ